MLDLRKLEYLHEVYRSGSFTEASRKLYVSQPAISSAITSLEKQLGVDLVIRNSKNLVFTPAGERFMVYVEHILQECQKAEHEMQVLSGQYDLSLRMGLSPSLAHLMLPYMYETFLSVRPDIQIQIQEQSMKNQIRGILDGELDLSFNALPAEPVKGIRVDKLGEVEIFAVLPKEHPLTEYEVLDIEMLNDKRISLPDQDSRIYELVRNECAEHDVVPRVVSHHNQINCMMDMVRYGNYICFVNDGDFMTMGENGGLEVRRMRNPLSIDVGFMSSANRPMPKAGTELMDYLKKTAKYWLAPSQFRK